MAVVFFLGPGMWADAKPPPREPPPMKVRRELADVLRSYGHRVIVMEDEPAGESEDLVQKFDRLLRSRVTDVVLYWPPLARMQTTYDELILLRDRAVLLRRKRIAIWALHHVRVAAITKGEFKILETGGRSRYLTAVARLGIHPLEWETDDDLRERVRLLAAELDA